MMTIKPFGKFAADEVANRICADWSGDKISYFKNISRYMASFPFSANSFFLDPYFSR
jgi:hypothetical protein